MMHDGYDWDAIILDRFCPILCAGFEDRCLGFLTSLPNNWRCQNGILLKYPSEVFPQNETNRHFMLDILKNHVENIIEIPITSSFCVDATKKLSKTLSKVTNESEILIMDISSMTRGNMLSFMDLLSSLSNNCYLAYTEPINYNDVSNYGVIDLVIVPGFEGIISQEKNNFGIYPMGFNTNYVYYIRDKYDISEELEYFLVGEISEKLDDTRNEWNKKAQENCNEVGIKPIKISPLDVECMAELMLEKSLEFADKYNQIIFPMGPKTFTVSAFLAHRKNPKIQICYPKPAGWSDTRSYGQGMTYIYSLKKF